MQACTVAREGMSVQSRGHRFGVDSVDMGRTSTEISSTRNIFHLRS